MCDCNNRLINILEGKLGKYREVINSNRLTDTGKSITQNFEGRCTQITEIIHYINCIQKGRDDRDTDL